MKRIISIAFWMVAIAIPILSSLMTITQLPADIEIPMHWNAQGQVDRFGSPWQMLPLSFIVSGCNALLALTYAFSDKLFDLGLVHGVSRRATRPFLCGMAVFLDIVWVGILVFWLYQVDQTSF